MAGYNPSEDPEYAAIEPRGYSPSEDPELKNTSVLTALQRSGDIAHGMVAQGLAGVADYAGSEPWRDYFQGAADKQTKDADSYNYQRPTKTVFEEIEDGNLMGAAQSAGYAAAENAAAILPGIILGAGSLSASPVIAAGSAAAAVGYGALSNLGDVLQTKEDYGLDKTATTTDLAAAAGLGLIDAFTGRLGHTAMAAARETVAGMITKYGVKGAIEGGGEAAQEAGVLFNAAVQGADVSGRDYAIAATEGFAAGGVTKGAMDAAGFAGSEAKRLWHEKVRVDKDITDDDILASEALLDAADGDVSKFANLDERDKQNNVKGVAGAARAKLRSELGLLMADARRLAMATDNREAIKALNTLRAVTANHTVRVPESYVKRLNTLLGPSVDVKRMQSLSNAISRIEGFYGASMQRSGLSQITRYFDITEPQGGFSRAFAAFGSISTGMVGVAANRAARGFDNLTNNRSRMKRFMDSVAHYEAKNPYAGVTLTPQGGPSFATTNKQMDLSKRLDAAKVKLDKRMAAEAKAAEKLKAKIEADAERTKRAESKEKADHIKWVFKMRQLTADLVAGFEAQAQKDAAAKTAEANALSIAAERRQHHRKIIERNRYNPKTPYGMGFKKWRMATGLRPQSVYSALQQLDPEFAELWASDIVAANKHPKAANLMEQVKNQFNPKGQFEAFDPNENASFDPTKGLGEKITAAGATVSKSVEAVGGKLGRDLQSVRNAIEDAAEEMRQARAAGSPQDEARAAQKLDVAMTMHLTAQASNEGNKAQRANAAYNIALTVAATDPRFEGVRDEVMELQRLTSDPLMTKEMRKNAVQRVTGDLLSRREIDAETGRHIARVFRDSAEMGNDVPYFLSRADTDLIENAETYLSDPNLSAEQAASMRGRVNDALSKQTARMSRYEDLLIKFDNKYRDEIDEVDDTLC